MTEKTWTVLILAAITVFCGYRAFTEYQKKDALNVLVCSNGLKDVRVVGISRDLSLAGNTYWLRDSEGNMQSYLKSEWEWCATLSATAAEKQGLLQ